MALLKKGPNFHQIQVRERNACEGENLQVTSAVIYNEFSWFLKILSDY